MMKLATIRELRAELEELDRAGLGDVTGAAWLQARRTLDRLTPGQVLALARRLGSSLAQARGPEEERLS